MVTFKETISTSWREMDRGIRIAGVGAALLAISVMIWGSYALLREDYGTLFAHLSDADAAVIVDALKHQKIPYKIVDGGATITVPRARINDTRLALMSSNVPLSGGVGFEIFDKQGLGATDQSQRVSYQRALQGELARTIAALDNVKQVRVHLVLPESSLFKRDRQEATAAITVTMKPGNALNRQQILGVQRLVAASVAGLDPAHVIILDQRGVTLSTADTSPGGAGNVEARLEVQRQIEAHIARKIARLLDSIYGSGQAIISVAASLSFDVIKTTTQDLLPVRGTTDGGIVRKRQVTSGSGTGNVDAVASDQAEGTNRHNNSTTEIEYEYGRRVEEVIASPGAVKRLTIGVIVPSRLGEDQQRRIRELVQVAAGIDESRGDIVSVQALGAAAILPTDTGPAHTDVLESSTELKSSASENPSGVVAGRILTRISHSLPLLAIVFFALLLIGALVGFAARALWSRSLSERQRQQLLQEIRRTLGENTGISQMQAKSE